MPRKDAEYIAYLCPLQSAASMRSYGIEPELGDPILPVHVDMGRLVAIACVEEEPVGTLAGAPLASVRLPLARLARQDSEVRSHVRDLMLVAARLAALATRQAPRILVHAADL
jgi:hypothetical protein